MSTLAASISYMHGVGSDGHWPIRWCSAAALTRYMDTVRFPCAAATRPAVRSKSTPLNRPTSMRHLLAEGLAGPRCESRPFGGLLCVFQRGEAVGAQGIANQFAGAIQRPVRAEYLGDLLRPDHHDVV